MSIHRSPVAATETPAHVAHLLTLGCDVMQGYALARPMPPGELSCWLGAFRPDPSWALQPGDIVDT